MVHAEDIITGGTNIYMNQTQYTKELEDIPVVMEDNMSDKKLKDNGDITKFKWVPTEDMLADALTKQRMDPTLNNPQEGPED